MIFRFLDTIGGAFCDLIRDMILAAARVWDECPSTVESELERTQRMREAADAKFRDMLENDLCECPNCKEKRNGKLPH